MRLARTDGRAEGRKGGNPRGLLMAFAALALVVSAPLSAQSNDLRPALELERQGRYGDAAARFQQTLRRNPADAAALFGLERVLQRLGRLPEMLPFLDSALARGGEQQQIRALQVRVLGTLERTDELEVVSERWIAIAPLREDPYREWAFAVAQRGDLPAARRILERGSRVLGGGALTLELAQVDIVSGDWSSAARHWHAAATARETVLQAAGMSLAQAPAGARELVLRALRDEIRDSTARWIAADLLLAWSRPGEAWTLLDSSLPRDRERAATLLKRFADRAQRTTIPEIARVRGYALERLAGLVSGRAVQQARIDAARAFADAGDRHAAERMLERIAADTARAPASAGGAMAALIAVTADAGRVEDAEQRFNEWASRLTLDDQADLRARIAWAWVRTGRLDRADAVLALDSSLAVAAIRGWVALYRGNLREAGEWFREAGPYTGTRDQATARTEMLALVQRVLPDSVPALGVALLELRSGDSASAVKALVVAARMVPRAGGRGDILALAARVAMARDDGQAGLLFEEVIAVDSTGPVVPAAHLALAALAARLGRSDEAVRRLEYLILAFPESAVIPQARRLLDQVQGAIPKS